MWPFRCCSVWCCCLIQWTRCTLCPQDPGCPLEKRRPLRSSWETMRTAWPLRTTRPSWNKGKWETKTLGFPLVLYIYIYLFIFQTRKDTLYKHPLNTHLLNVNTILSKNECGVLGRITVIELIAIGNIWTGRLWWSSVDKDQQRPTFKSQSSLC